MSIPKVPESSIVVTYGGVIQVAPFNSVTVQVSITFPHQMPQKTDDLYLDALIATVKAAVVREVKSIDAENARNWVGMVSKRDNPF